MDVVEPGVLASACGVETRCSACYQARGGKGVMTDPRLNGVRQQPAAGSTWTLTTERPGTTQELSCS